MSLKTQSAERYAGAADTVNCPGCSAVMPREMRFCRMCGYRLGEGLSEYTETVRFDAGFAPSAAAPLAPADGARHFASPAAAVSTFGPPARPRRAKRAHWIVWPILGLCIAGVSGGAAIVGKFGDLRSRFASGAPAAPRSFFGGGDFTRVAGEGLMIESVLPGGPAERAGLADGDILTKLDGRAIADEDDLRAALRQIPVGKSVEVEFLRDGAPQRAVLTTIAAAAYNPRAFIPPNGSGYWGVSSLRRVSVPGTNLHGVRLGSVAANRPADLAGLKKDDIVVEFDGRPVRTTDGLGTLIDHAAPGTVVRVTVYRDGQRLDIPVKMGKDD